jgi:hypothetical protein
MTTFDSYLSGGESNIHSIYTKQIKPEETDTIHIQ